MTAENARVSMSYEERIKAEARARRIRLQGPDKVVNIARAMAETAISEGLKKVDDPHVDNPPLEKSKGGAHNPKWMNFECSSSFIAKWSDVDQNGRIDYVKFRVRTMREIAMDVLDQYPGITLSDIKGPSRRRSIVAPRHHIVWAIKTERPDVSYPALGRWMGDRDHTTSLAGHRRHEAKLAAKLNEGQT